MLRYIALNLWNRVFSESHLITKVAIRTCGLILPTLRYTYVKEEIFSRKVNNNFIKIFSTKWLRFAAFCYHFDAVLSG